MSQDILRIFKSTRFQALVLLAVIFFAGDMGWLSGELVQAFALILGGHVGIRTVDRFSEKIAANGK